MTHPECRLTSVNKTIFAWPTIHGELVLYHTENQLRFVLNKLSFLETDIDLCRLSEKQIQAFCHSCYPVLSKLETGVYKVSLYVRGCGGMLSQTQTARYQQLNIAQGNDEDISRALRQSLSATEYTAIYVKSRNFAFPYSNRETPTRHIQLTVGYWDSFANWFRKLFCKIGVIGEPTDDIGLPIYSAMIDGNRVHNEVLSITDEASDRARELTKTFRRNATIDIFIAKDLSDIHINITPGAAIETCVIL